MEAIGPTVNDFYEARIVYRDISMSHTQMYVQLQYIHDGVVQLLKLLELKQFS